MSHSYFGGRVGATWKTDFGTGETPTLKLLAISLKALVDRKIFSHRTPRLCGQLYFNLTEFNLILYLLPIPRIFLELDLLFYFAVKAMTCIFINK